MNEQHTTGRAHFQDQVTPYMRDLFAVAMHLTRDERDAEDLVQDALLRAYTNFEKFRHGTNLRAWLVRILTNSFINTYRRKKKEREILRREGADISTGNLYGHDRVWAHARPESTWLSAALSHPVVTALEAVPENYRVVVILTDLLDFSYQETADIVGCPVGTVMSRLFRGRRLLRRRLAGYAVEHSLVSRDVVEAAMAA